SRRMAEAISTGLTSLRKALANAAEKKRSTPFSKRSRTPIEYSFPGRGPDRVRLAPALRAQVPSVRAGLVSGLGERQACAQQDDRNDRGRILSGGAADQRGVAPGSAATRRADRSRRRGSGLVRAVSEEMSAVPPGTRART